METVKIDISETINEMEIWSYVIVSQHILVSVNAW